jgi:hypothetical protein
VPDNLTTPPNASGVPALPSTYEAWVDRYLRNPAVRALAQLIPFGAGSAIDTFVATGFTNLRARRRKQFFTALEEGGVQLTPEIVASDDFLHCFAITVAAVDRTRREEKIRMFARLLVAATTQGEPRNIDDYEELLEILDQLSESEMRVLRALEEYEATYYESGRFKGEGRARGLLLPIAAKHLGNDPAQLSDGDLRAMVMRLNRVGLYGLFGWREGPAHDCSLTPLYFRLKRLVLDASGVNT